MISISKKRLITSNNVHIKFNVPVHGLQQNRFLVFHRNNSHNKKRQKLKCLHHILTRRWHSCQRNESEGSQERKERKERERKKRKEKERKEKNKKEKKKKRKKRKENKRKRKKKKEKEKKRKKKKIILRKKWMKNKIKSDHNKTFTWSPKWHNFQTKIY